MPKSLAPQSARRPFPVVGLGASAGGTEAFVDFLEAMPAENGMAFVILLQLAPDRCDHRADLLRKATAMPVQHITTPTQIEKNHVYVIATSFDFVRVDERSWLTPVTRPEGLRFSIDLFFRSLAEALHERAICVVLSGSGSDGSVGLKRIREKGGATLAQAPSDAEFESMPRSAIATGAVDIVLPAVEMPQRLIALRNSIGSIRAAIEDGIDSNIDSAERAKADEDALREIMTMLRTRTSHDFRSYKRATVLRRIERRLQVNGLSNLSEYRDFFHAHVAETRFLLQDMLISVTNFFRDNEAFEALRSEVIPKVFANRPKGESVRAWTAGIATGEEAYSIAMLLEEGSIASQHQTRFQLFATDIDEHAIAVARAGVYPDAIATDIAPERIKMFFSESGAQYHVKKKLRERILFARHNVLSDHPFSKLDLVCCRNLLIYLDRSAQAEVLKMFHFALRPGGYLFLGNSESTEVADKFFTVVDKKHRIYSANPAVRASFSLPMIVDGGLALALAPVAADTTVSARKPRESFGEIHQRMLEQFASPSVLLSRDSQIVHVSDHAGRFLRYADGEPSHNIISAIRSELQLELRTGIFQALENSHSVEAHHVRLVQGGRPVYVKMTIRPVFDPASSADFVLVLFDEVEDDMNLEGRALAGELKMNPMVARLEREVQRTKTELAATILQSATSTEDLKASNEELQAINEELRSATEELEISREELQSTNKELASVNAKLWAKIDEIISVSDDLQNLNNANDIGTLFIDGRMRIKRYTPRITEVFSIIESDIGRSLRDITHRLDYEKLADDAAEAFNSLRVIEREVGSVDGQRYIARFTPYRTAKDHIDGAVLTLIKLTHRREAQEPLLDSQRSAHVDVGSAKG
jgi:two-component system CheB/CheR fusion protein